MRMSVAGKQGLVLQAGWSLQPKHTRINSIHNRAGGDSSSAEKSSIKALYSLLSTGNLFELDVNLSLRIWVKWDVYYFAILRFTLSFDIVLKLFNPCFTGFSVIKMWLAWVESILYASYQDAWLTLLDQTCFSIQYNDLPLTHWRARALAEASLVVVAVVFAPYLRVSQLCLERAHPVWPICA